MKGGVWLIQFLPRYFFYFFKLDKTPTQQTQDIEPLLVQCWSTVYDAGSTLNQQFLNILCLLGRNNSHVGNPICIPDFFTWQDSYPANTSHWSIVGLMLVHRLRRWPNIKPTMTRRLVFKHILTSILTEHPRESQIAVTRRVGQLLLTAAAILTNWTGAGICGERQPYYYSKWYWNHR